MIIYHNRKTNMTLPESRGPTPARSEHPKADEAEEIMTFKNFYEDDRSPTEEMRKFFKEMEEKNKQK